MSEKDLAAVSGGTGRLYRACAWLTGSCALRTSTTQPYSPLSSLCRARICGRPICPGLAYLDRDVAAAGAAQRKLLAPRTLGPAHPGRRPQSPASGRSTSAAGPAIRRRCWPNSAAKSLCSSWTREPSSRRARRSEQPSGVTLTQGDLATGAPHGPFDVIVINGGWMRPRLRRSSPDFPRVAASSVSTRAAAPNAAR